jgi:hypothetical protein
MTSDLAKSLSESPDKEDVVEDVPMGRYGLLIFFASTLGIMAMIPMVKVNNLNFYVSSIIILFTHHCGSSAIFLL